MIMAPTAPGRLAALVVAEALIVRDEAILEDDLRGVRRADAELAFLAALAHPGRAFLDDEAGHACGSE
jgi:hypothetical protein